MRSFRYPSVYSASLLSLQALRQCFGWSLVFSHLSAAQYLCRLRPPRWCRETSHCFPHLVKHVETMIASDGWRLRGYSVVVDAPGGRAPPRAWVWQWRHWKWWRGDVPLERSTVDELVVRFQGLSSLAPMRSDCSASQPLRGGCRSETASQTQRGLCCAAPEAERLYLPVFCWF